MSALDAYLGRIQSDGVELELGGGLNFQGGLVARLNSSTQLIDITYDGSGINDVTVDPDSGYDFGGHPIRNVHDFISPATAQTVAASGSPAYDNLEINGGTKYTSLYGGFGVPQPVGGSVLSKAVIGFRVEWRNDTTGATMYTDELRFGVGWREDSNDLYVQAHLVNTVGDGEGAANANVTVVTYGGSGAQYRLTLQADGTIYLAMMQDASTARRVMVETFRGSSIRNMI